MKCVMFQSISVLEDSYLQALSELRAPLGPKLPGQSRFYCIGLHECVLVCSIWADNRVGLCTVHKNLRQITIIIYYSEVIRSKTTTKK